MILVPDPRDPIDVEEYHRCVFADSRGRARVWLEASENEVAYTLDNPWLTRRDVIMAIAAVLIGRRQEGVNFAYGPPELFECQSADDVYDLDPYIEPFGSGDELLIPIMLDDEPAKEAAKEKIAPTAHPPVALAHATFDGVTLTLNLLFSRFHSVEGDINPSPFVQIARAVLRRWSRLGPEADAIVERFQKTQYIDEPHAFEVPGRWNTARRQLVANAWAIIYGHQPAYTGRLVYPGVDTLNLAFPVMVSSQTSGHTPRFTAHTLIVSL